MGYRIEYDTQIGKYEIRQSAPWRFPAMIAGALTLFLLLTWAFWPEGADVLRDMLIPGDDAVTVQALEAMASELKAGVSLGDAVESFCRGILDGAKGSH